MQDIFLILVVFTLGAFLFGVVSFVRPTEIILPSSSPYDHSGHFSYTAAVPRSIYDSDTLKSGEPIFRRISDSFDVTFDYQLSSEAISEVAGTYLVNAEISSSNGWARTVGLEDSTDFDGAKVSILTTIDIDFLQSFVDKFAEETGIKASQYFVTILPEINMQGKYKGEEWSDTFTPELAFRVSELQVELSSESESLEDTLFQSKDGTLFDVVPVDNRIALLGMDLNIHSARLSSIVLVALFASASVYVGLRIVYLGKQPEAERILGLYGGLIIPVSGIEPEKGKKVVEVENIEHLIRLAQQEGVSILEESGKDNLHFFVQGGSNTYHFQVAK